MTGRRCTPADEILSLQLLARAGNQLGIIMQIGDIERDHIGSRPVPADLERISPWGWPSDIDGIRMRRLAHFARVQDAAHPE